MTTTKWLAVLGVIVTLGLGGCGGEAEPAPEHAAVETPPPAETPGEAAPTAEAAPTEAAPSEAAPSEAAPEAVPADPAPAAAAPSPT